MSNPFNIVGQETNGTPVQAPSTDKDIKSRIQELIGSSDLFLFMKGTPDFPQCGFSANTIAILNSFNKPFKTFDILTDPEIRQGVKEFSNWPTYPQLYLKGELLGGNDIITELFHSGELSKQVETL